jgi:hypothetical protein
MIPENLGDITVADVLKAKDHDEHMRLVQQWNESVWAAWAPHHGKVKEWYKNYIAKK